MAMQVIQQVLGPIGSSPKREGDSSMPHGTESAMEKTAWMSMVKNELKNSPIASNTFFGVILVCLEKLVEVEFACPCKAHLNALFSAAYFFVPAVLVFVLMVNVQGTQCGKKMFSSLVPAIMWLIIMFLDGHYFACAMTYWYGSYETIENAAPQKWCEPANNSSSQEYLIKTQDWYSLSQAIGMGHIILLGFVLRVSGMVPQKKNKEDEEEGYSPVQDKDPEAPEPKKNQDRDGSGDIPLQDIKKL